MNVAVTTMGCDGGRSGIGQYAVHLLHEFGLGAADSFDVYVHPGEQSAFLSANGVLHPVEVADRVRHPALNLAWHQAVLPSLCRRRGYDVVFLPAANRRVPLRLPCPMVGTVHDFSSIHMEGKYDPLRLIYIKKVLPRLVRGLTHVIADSECTKKDVVEFAGYPEEHVTTIPLGVNHEIYYPRDKKAALAELRTYFASSEKIASSRTPRIDGIGPYILYISRIENPGKNHIRLIDAFGQVKRRLGIPHQLVLAGSDWTRADQVHEHAEKSPCRNDIFFTGFMPASQLPNLYCGADLFVFPSLFEGFGLPVLEAMACGVPVVCSNVSSIPEVGGDAVGYFDPCEAESIADAMGKAIEDKQLYQQCRLRGLERAAQFTWSNTARATLAVLRQNCG